jgi:SEL1 protein
VATTYFETAVRQGSPFEAYYYLAVIQSQLAQNPVQAGTCAMAVSFHKIVAERGVWGDDLLRDAEVAWSSETDRGKEMAMLKWWIAAERGLKSRRII